MYRRKELLDELFTEMINEMQEASNFKDARKLFFEYGELIKKNGGGIEFQKQDDGTVKFTLNFKNNQFNLNERV